ncbi:MAG: hypothetical protein II948_04115 [Synergistaceae bacterium]|nr:hypothetical protein [Synergistaceae bacterium]MBQ4418240.1 hypothetical protein [Synergistaceae bacterium]MBQ7570586.1 hypothetical protein [Synergistaceae bacterium]MBQ9581341.1 hypothetical protein [Synergistaceae bacterium]MBQ9896360.1 hypothetical protein [Synergistaceae bacterium]
MGKEVYYKRSYGTPLTPEEISMLEDAKNFQDEYDDDNPEITPYSTPELYKAMMDAVTERNQRTDRALLKLA